MRSLGYTSAKVKRLYFYEAFVLVLSASTAGIFIGVMIGWTMMFQQTKFLGIPRFYFFPWKHFIVISCISSVCSYLAVKGPITLIT